MHPDTLKALNESIAHWKRMRAMTWKERSDPENPEIPGGASCALCQRFPIRCDLSSTDEKCPVYKRTGSIGCNGSPYGKAAVAFDDESDEAWQQAADAEIAFLESLLPTKEQ